MDFSRLCDRSMTLQGRSYASDGAATVTTKLTGIPMTVQPLVGMRPEQFGQVEVVTSHYGLSPTMLDTTSPSISNGDILTDPSTGETYEVKWFTGFRSVNANYFWVSIDKTIPT